MASYRIHSLIRHSVNTNLMSGSLEFDTLGFDLHLKRAAVWKAAEEHIGHARTQC